MHFFFLLVSGTINSIRLLLPQYDGNHSLIHTWGLHILLALVAFTLSIWLLKGPTPPHSHKRASLATITILIMAVAAAGALKQMRESAVRPSATRPAVP